MKAKVKVIESHTATEIKVTLPTGQQIGIVIKNSLDTMQIDAENLGYGLQINPVANNRILIKSIAN